MAVFANWNGNITDEEKICISPSNRSFRYGDGCFETMKMMDGKLLLADLHFQRLFSSLETLQFVIPDFFTPYYLNAQIDDLVRVNGHDRLARVRLVAYRGDGGLYDLDNNTVNFIIQTWTGKSDSNYFNQAGLSVNVYPDARIAADRFSPIKSNNYLSYAMAAMFAKQKGLDDCILTNAFNRVADCTIANVFVVSDGIIKTPSLAEGCVSGVMRKYLLGCLMKEEVAVIETEISLEELSNATEVFLTNATVGIRWVQSVGNSSYTNSTSSRLHQKFIAPLFSPSTF